MRGMKNYNAVLEVNFRNKTDLRLQFSKDDCRVFANNYKIKLLNQIISSILSWQRLDYLINLSNWFLTMRYEARWSTCLIRGLCKFKGRKIDKAISRTLVKRTKSRTSLTLDALQYILQIETGLIRVTWSTYSLARLPIAVISTRISDQVNNSS